MKSTVKVSHTKKEYPELTYEQLKELVKLRNQGMTEEEALEVVLNG